MKRLILQKYDRIQNRSFRATILSFGMALRYSLDLDKEADTLEKAVQGVLDEGLRTKDILSNGTKEVSTSEMGDAIISKLQ